MTPHQILVGLLILYPALAWWLFRVLWVSENRLRAILLKLSLLVGSSLYLFGALEYYFMHSVAISDGFGQTLMHRNWINKYGDRPKNSFGLRDAEPVMGDKPTLYVVGDSFTAGHGIDDHRDRYANLLENHLAGEWDLMLLAKGGWGTEKQLEVYSEWSNLREDREGVIVWQYYINDIDHSGIATGLTRPSIQLGAPRLLKPVVDNYHLANFLYWGVFRAIYAQQLGEQYLSYLTNCYENQESWDHHQQQLQRVADLRQRSELTTVEEIPPERKLIVVVYPNLKDIEGTRKMSEKVVSFFRTRDVDVVDMAELLADYESDEITVNALDGHANEMVNRLLADHLYQHFFQQF